jgi:mono/diheme cytochrome c family protein
MGGRVPAIVAVAVAALAACSEQEVPEQTEPSAADTLEMAIAQYDPAAFDSISWEKPDEAVVRGSVVFSYSCKKCHGAQGYGDGGFVARGDTLRPPSFHDADWELKGDLEGLRRQVYVGSLEGMPHWGLEGLKYRDVDAVARFILDRLTGEE